MELLETEPYSSFNFKQTLYSHFQRVLGTPENALLLTDAKFASKVKPSRKYSVCEINTANLFDEDGDPIFNLDVPTSLTQQLQQYALINQNQTQNKTLA